MLKIKCAIFILRVLAFVVADDSHKCQYFDSVDLEDNQRFDNGSYLYNDILIPKENVHQYTYRETVFKHNKTVEPYMRGCLCQIKSCVLLCCEPEKSMRNLIVNMTLNNGTRAQVNVRNEFAVQVKYSMSCDVLDDPHYDAQARPKWRLFQNGTLYNPSDDDELDEKDYCFLPYKVSDGNYYLLPQTIKPNIEYQKELDKSCAIRIPSLFCIVIIIVVYLYLPHLHNGVFNQCCMYYFICLGLTFMWLWVESHFHNIYEICYFIAYCGYYTVMSTFLWLLVINYTLWQSLTNLQKTPVENMLRYHIFVWGSAAIFTSITGYMDSQDIDEEIKYIWHPDLGKYACWIRTNAWSAMVYYYGPILLIIVINLTLSIITARHLYTYNRKNNQAWNNSESKKNLKNSSDFMMFTRMFAVSGVCWILEILSYLMNQSFGYNMWFFEIVMNGQGLILFFATIWKKDVIKALIKRLEKTHDCTTSTSHD